MEIENLFIIYIPGSGGNHLANMISTSKRFTRSVDFDQYSTQHRSFKFSSHFSEKINLEFSDEYLKSISKQSNVFSCVLVEYLWNQDRIAPYLPNQKFIVIEANNYTSSIAHRITQFYPAFAEEKFQRPETLTLCSTKYFRRLSESTDVTPLPIDTLFCPSIDLLDQFLKKEFGIEINYKLCQSIHANWYNAFKIHYIDKFDV